MVVGAAIPSAARAEEPPSSSSPEAVLAQAQHLYDTLEYDQVLPLVRNLRARQGLATAILIQAYQLEGSSLAIVGAPEEADSSFRLLVRLQPDFDLPTTTPPKILSVFRRVRDEERTLASQVEALRRGKIVESLSLEGAPPVPRPGGYPIHFRYHLRDPTGAVSAIEVPYRREGRDRSLRSCWSSAPGDLGG